MENAIIDYETGEIQSIQDQEWYGALVEDCKAIVTEAVFNSRWALVEGYHQLGERIVTDENYQKAAKGNLSSLQGLAKNIGVGERTLYYAIQFYEKYPDLSLVPEGKNITWSKLITLYLPSPDKPFEPPNDINAAYCDMAFEVLLQEVHNHNAKWLLSDEGVWYFQTLKIPYESIKDWAKTGCKEMRVILGDYLKKEYVNPVSKEKWRRHD